ncbi:DoxX family protein [Nocardia sp. NBC_00511]|uniref:DoxX family protein n=1 Tax=Nocardia sp. NBC_00511 TaxID=2903591 RepID=UPI0030DE4736
MFIAYVVVTLIAIAANAVEGVATLAGAKFVRDNLGEIGLPPALLPFLGACKTAGALGLIGGLVAWRHLGVAAAIGLTVFYLLAVLVHLRTRVVHNIAFPIGFLALAAATLALAALH